MTNEFKESLRDINDLIEKTKTNLKGIFRVMYKINEKYSMDIVLGTDMQKWSLPTTVRILGKPYQGSGLRDTMSDLIVDSLGALITSVICYFLYKHEKKKTLDMMHEIFLEE